MTPATPETPTAVRLPRPVWVLGAIALCVALGFGIVIPAIPVYARSFGVSAFAASTVVSVFAAMRLVGAPIAGRLINSWGERRVLSTGLMIVAVSSLLAGLAQNFTQLLVLRGLGGIGSSMFTVSALALLLHTTPAELRGRASGIFQSGFLIGAVLGPAIGAFIIGVSIRAPFFFYFATLLLATIVALVWLPRPHHVESVIDHTEEPASLTEALRDNAYWAAMLVNFAVGFTFFGLRSSEVPLYVVEGLGAAASITGIGFLVSAAVQGLALFPAGRYADRHGRKPVMIAGGVLALLSMVLLGLNDSSVPAFLVAMAIAGLGGGLLGPAPPAVVGDITSGRPGGTVVALFQMVSDVGSITGPLIAGLLIDSAGFSWGFYVGATVCGLSLLASLRMRETLRPASG